MPADKPLTIATYAAGAGLAAITLVYVFGPTFFLDDEAAHSTKSSRKKGVVGLYNPANDCFINSVLQTLAGLPELRTYLIREMHRRNLDGKEIYSLVAKDDDGIRPNEGKDIVERKEVKEPEWKRLGLQQGIVTAGLKQILDALNERPIIKKTISASGFVHVLEQAFRTRISRQQQDAQEFLQVVTERLSEECYAGRSARRKARSRSSVVDVDKMHPTTSSSSTTTPPSPLEEDFSFPFEGKIESQIECTYCHFKPKPSVSSFVTLTLNVPTTTTSTSLSSCFDSMLKIEHIDDFKCEYCRLQHAIEHAKEDEMPALKHALETDPENPPAHIKLPDSSKAPRRKIARHMRISRFPRILAIHLSRSVWAGTSPTSKNLAKVSFPESLPLGGLLDQRQYTLLGVVTHKGGHNSGHYESFRRQYSVEPKFSAGLSMGTKGVYSTSASPAASGVSSPTEEEDSAPRSLSVSERFTEKAKSLDLARQRRIQNKKNSRWWRISDEKIKESNTKEVLGMQREVYLLFYEVV